jgi:hypothetical protein
LPENGGVITSQMDVYNNISGSSKGLRERLADSHLRLRHGCGVASFRLAAAIGASSYTWAEAIRDEQIEARNDEDR